MSDPAAPWWAEVQHLRPRDDHAEQPTTPSSAPSRRFGRGAAEEHDAAIATLEHEIADPWATDDVVAPWAETLEQPASYDEPSSYDAPDAATESRSPLWDDALEEAFARTPSWADEDDERLLPKGANRIENGRRTIEIRGQVDRIHGVAPIDSPGPQRIRGRMAHERVGPRPDKVALWAVLLGLLLILVAAISSPGADAAALLVTAAL